MKTKLERPPAIEDGEYWIGRFLVEVKGGHIGIMPRQLWSHNHQRIDTILVKHFDANYCSIELRPHEDSAEAERRINKLVRSKEWRPRRYKTR